MPHEFVRCEWCDRRLDEGDVYYEQLVARRVVGNPPPTYAAKVILCEHCEGHHDHAAWREEADLLAYALSGVDCNHTALKAYEAFKAEATTDV